MLRLIPGVKPPIHDGAVPQETFPGVPLILIVSQDYRFTGGSKNIPPTEAGATPQNYEFKPNQPNRRRYYLPDGNRGLSIGPEPQLEGAITADTVPFRSLLLVVSQDYRFTGGSTRQFDGPISQQTFPVPPVTTNPTAWIELLRKSQVNLNPRIMGPVDQYEGPTTQQTYTFYPGQPELSRFKLKDALRYIVGEVPYLTPDAVAVVQTDVFNFFQLDSRYTPGRQYLRSIQLDGATNQQTYEFEPNQPELRGYDLLRLFSRWNTGPTKQFDGPTNQQRFEFFPAQPDQARFRALRDFLRYATSPAARTEGATSQQTYEFPVNQPELIRFEQSKNGFRFRTAPPVRFEGPTVQDWFIYPTEQPELRGYALRDLLRYIVGVQPRLETIVAQNQQTYEFFPGQPDLTRYDRVRQFNRFIVEAIKRVEGPTVTQEGFQFKPNQPDLARYSLKDQLRYLVAAQKILDGATVQQLFQFFPGQPELRRYNLLDPNRVERIGPTAQLDGALRQQLFEFAKTQPELRRWLLAGSYRLVSPVPQLDVRGFQSYEFPVNQPKGWPITSINRWLANGPKVQLDGPTTQQRYEFPVNQPNRWRYPKTFQPLHTYRDDTVRVVVDTQQLPMVQANPRPDWFGRVRRIPDHFLWEPLDTIPSAAFNPCFICELQASDGTTKGLVAVGLNERGLLAASGDIPNLVAVDATEFAFLANDGTIFFLKGVC